MTNKNMQILSDMIDDMAKEHGLEIVAMFLKAHAYKLLCKKLIEEKNG